MTMRSVILGLIGALSIAGVAYMNDQVLGLSGQSPLSGHQIPIGVIGSLIVFLTTVNPLLSRLRRSWGLKPAELAISTTMMLVACSVPLVGLMEHFPNALGLPAYWNVVNPGWQKNRVLGYVPPALLPAEGRLDRGVTDAMLSGLGSPRSPISLKEVPWAKWAQCLSFWLPLVVLLAVSVICLALVVHRQWSYHERLRYPIAEFTSSLLDGSSQGLVGSIFRSKLFWIGLVGVTAIHLINGLDVWLDGKFIHIPLTFNFGAIRRRWPELQQIQWSPRFDHPAIFPIVLGFSFFLASEISLSLGLTQVFYILSAYVLTVSGVDMSTSFLVGGVYGWLRMGGYAAFALVLLYTGRRYYLTILKAAVSFRKEPGMERYAAWACRLLLLSLVCMTAMMIAAGLDWPLAILCVGLIMLIFFCSARITAETGLFNFQARWQPLGALLGFLGAYAMGPKAMILVGMFSIILTLDISQSLISYFINGLRICQNHGVRPARAAWAGIGTYLAALVLAVAVTFWAVYNFGVNKQNPWTFRSVPSSVFASADREITQLKLDGRLAASEALGPLERLAECRPSGRFLWSAGVGMAAVLVFGAMRLRFSWWPLHPVLFLVWETAPMSSLSHSFLLGWFIKMAVTRLGGHRIYQKTKPLMIGLIAGDLLGPSIFILYGAVYYGMTGLLPAQYDYFHQ